MRPIYLIFGPPGSGKTWVCEQLSDQYHYVPHDTHLGRDYGRVLLEHAQLILKPILGDAPFGVSALIEKLTQAGATVKPHFIIEKEDVLKKRYFEREQKMIPRGHVTRLETLKNRANRYHAPSGTAEEILKLLKSTDLN